MDPEMQTHLLIKSVSHVFFIASMTFGVTGCSEQSMKTLQEIGGALGETKPSLTNEEVIAGLREALSQGTNKGTALASKTDGFYKNVALFIPFPPEAQAVKSKALALGLSSQVDKFEQTLNRAAEEACKTAAPIFLGAIKEMTIQDGFSILRGADSAATNYLKEKTTAKLPAEFRPVIQQAVDKVQLTSYWQPLITAYNTATILTGSQTINPDLTGYVNEKATAGLFLLIEKEEKYIRQDPAGRVTELLKKVFGYSFG